MGFERYGDLSPTDEGFSNDPSSALEGFLGGLSSAKKLHLLTEWCWDNPLRARKYAGSAYTSISHLVSCPIVRGSGRSTLGGRVPPCIYGRCLIETGPTAWPPIVPSPISKRLAPAIAVLPLTLVAC